MPKEKTKSAGGSKQSLTESEFKGRKGGMKKKK